jgi:hypothetical protein
MTNKVYDYYKDLPSWAKGVSVVGGLLIVYIIGNRIYKGIKASSEFKSQRETLNQQESEIRNLQQTGMRLTFPTSQYKAWADAIATAFGGCDPMDNSLGAVARPINAIKNDLDFLELQTSFAIREYDQCGWGAGNFKGNLQSAIADELTTSQINFLNKILRDKGIKYSFS